MEARRPVLPFFLLVNRRDTFFFGPLDFSALTNAVHQLMFLPFAFAVRIYGYIKTQKLKKPCSGKKMRAKILRVMPDPRPKRVRILIIIGNI
jgi:hypothetical protein